MSKYGEAAIAEMLISSLPQIMEQVAKPMSNIDKITVIDTGDGKGGASSIAKTVTNVAGSGFEVLKDLTGLDVSEILKSYLKPNENDKPDMDEIVETLKNKEASKENVLNKE